MCAYILRCFKRMELKSVRSLTLLSQYALVICSQFAISLVNICQFWLISLGFLKLTKFEKTFSRSYVPQKIPRNS